MIEQKEKITFRVQGSVAEPYIVTFARRGANLSGHCTCAAGENGQYCKHRFAILGGATEGVVSENAEDVALVASWLPGTDVEQALDSLGKAIARFEEAKATVSAAKKRLAGALRN